MLILTADQLAYIQFLNEKYVRQIQSVFLAFVFFSVCFAGCLSDLEQEKGEITLLVGFEQTSGVVVQSFADGELVSTENVVLIFDFSKTYSNSGLNVFGIDMLDENTSMTVDAQADSSISIEFLTHGIYELNAYAIDNQNHIANMSITIRIEMRIEWVESSTYEPESMTIDSIPANGRIFPNSIVINSTVENPEIIEDVASGREVEFTWSLVDSAEDACQVRSGLVHEGELVNWETLHFNTFLVHELRISYDSGQDYINVNQSVHIQYEEIESKVTILNAE